MATRTENVQMSMDELIKNVLAQDDSIVIPVGISRLGLIGWLRNVLTSKKSGGTMFKSPIVNSTLYIRSLEWHSRSISNNGDPVIKDGTRDMDNADLAFSAILQEITSLEQTGKSAANSDAFFNSPPTKYDSSSNETTIIKLNKGKSKETTHVYIPPPSSEAIGKGQPFKRSYQVVGPRAGSFMPAEIFGDYREAAGKFSGSRDKMSMFPGYKIPIDTSNIIPPDIDFNGSNARPISTINITMLKPKTPNDGINELIAKSKLDPKELALQNTTIITTDDDNTLEIVDTPLKINKNVKLLVPVKANESGLSLLEGVDVKKISSSGRGTDVYKVEDLKRIAKRYGLATSGSKAKLVERIEEYLTENGVDLIVERNKPSESSSSSNTVPKRPASVTKNIKVTIEDITEPKNRVRKSKVTK